MNNGYYVINLHVKPIWWEIRLRISHRICTVCMNIEHVKATLPKLWPVRAHKATDWLKYDLQFFFLLLPSLPLPLPLLSDVDNNFCWLQIIFTEVHLHLWQLRVQLRSQLHNFYGKWTIYLDFHPIHCSFRCKKKNVFFFHSFYSVRFQLNSIEWKTEWGGWTVLFDRHG